MPIVGVLPWCRLDKTYFLGDVTLRRICRGQTSMELSLSRAAARAFDVFRDAHGGPLAEVVLLQSSADSGDDTKRADDAVEIACFSALSNRDFEVLGSTPESVPANYCNADMFRRFRIEMTSSCRVISGITRRDGVPVMEASRVYAPLETAFKADEVPLDEALGFALAQRRESAEKTEWHRLRDSIDYFNQANSDSPLLTRRAAWILVCCAFQRLLGKKDALTDAKKTGECLRDFLKQRGVASPDAELLGCWLEQFCRLRNDPAHGKRNSPKDSNWALRHHILIATLAFPLLVGLQIEPQRKEAYVSKLRALARFATVTKQETEDLSSLTTWELDKRGPKTWREFVDEYQQTLASSSM